MTVMGCDPHLDTFDAVVVNDMGAELARAHLANTTQGWAQAAQLGVDHRVEAAGVEAASGYGRHLAVALGEAGIEVLEIPTRLTARMRLRDGRAKTDVGDARAIARLVAAGEGHQWTNNPATETVRVLTHRRKALVGTQNREINELRALIGEVDPARSARLGRIRSRKAIEALTHVEYDGDRHRQTVATLIRSLAVTARDRHDQIKQLTKQIEEALPQNAIRLIEDMPGVGVVTAATLIAEMAGTDGFATDAKMAAWAGTAPLDASSGRQQRHRLNRGGNRQANWAIHMITLTQTRHHPPAIEYINRRQTEGLTHKEATRALKRHITRQIWKTLKLT